MNNLEAYYKYYSNATKEQAIEDMYLDNCKLAEENEYLRYIIKEAKEYIKWHYNLGTEDNVEFCLLRDRLLEILEKSDKE